MSELAEFMKFVIMYRATQQAGAMGWIIEHQEDKLILRKKKANMTKLDKNTGELLDAIFIPVKTKKDHNANYLSS